MRTLILIGVFVFACYSLFAQLDPETYAQEVSRLEGDIFAVCAIGGQDLEQPVQELKALAEQQADWEQYLTAYFWRVYCHDESNRLPELQEALQDFEAAITDKQALLDSQQLVFVRISHAYYQAVSYQKRGDYGKAISYYERTQPLLEQAYALGLGPEIDNYQMGLFNSLGTIYRLRGNTQSAIETYQAAIAFSQEQNESSFWGLHNKYLGDAHLQRAEYAEALRYYLIARTANEDSYRQNRDDDRARNRLLSTLNAIADVYLQRNLPDSSLYYLQASLKLQPRDYLYRPATYHQLGEVYARQQAYEQAQYYFQQALNGKEAVYGPQTVEVATTLRAMGDLMVQRQRPALGLTFYQRSLESLVPGFLPTSLADNPPLQELFSRRELLLTLRQKAYGLVALSRQQPDNPLPLPVLALQTTQLAVSLIDSLKLGYEAETDKQFLLGESYPLFELGLDLCYQLHQQSGDRSYLKEAFRLIEKSRAVVLYESQKKARARRFAGIPETLHQEEQRFRFALTNLQDSLQAQADPSQQQARYQRFAALRHEYAALVQQFEKEYPAYYRLKYDVSVLDLNTAQQNLLQPGEAILEYFLGDEHLYLLDIRANACSFHQLERGPDLEQRIQALREGIYGYYTSPETLQEADYGRLAQQYTEQAYALYQICFAPYLSQPGLPFSLTIIPDGMLGYVPFSALLTQKVSQPTQFKTHPYLLEDHKIAYSYSVSMMAEMQQDRPRAAEQKVLAFAPVFEGDALALRGIKPPALPPLAALPYTRQEVAAIADILPSTTFLAEMATRDRFLALAPKYSLLHLATHGILNDKDPDRSFLAFYAPSDQPQLLPLYVRDLYALPLQSELVVLSACETGIGQLSRGEGLLSMARGFSYAGAKSLITTLWSIPDGAANSGLLPTFYTLLRDGQDKALALRGAQLEQVHTAFTENLAHPFYWAAFTPVGNMEPLPAAGATFWPWFLGGFLTIVLLFGMWRWILSRKLRA